MRVTGLSPVSTTDVSTDSARELRQNRGFQGALPALPGLAHDVDAVLLQLAIKVGTVHSELERQLADVSLKPRVFLGEEGLLKPGDPLVESAFRLCPAGLGRERARGVPELRGQVSHVDLVAIGHR